MKNLCGNCFSELNGEVCHNCGYINPADVQEPYALVVGTVLKDRYLIGKTIGKGGFGITYLSYDIKLDKTVALKEYFPRGMAVRASDNVTVEVLASEQINAFKEGQEKFSSEAAMLYQVKDCPEIIGMFDIFDANGTAYCVMEFVNGVTLKEYTSSDGAITTNQAVYILKKLLPSLNILHKYNIIHRDITPENIILCHNGDVKLIDFGSARYFSENTEDNYSVILKPGFAPLEQYQRNGNQGAWTDIYSLALSLYYGMTLNIPYDPMTRLDDDAPFCRELEAIPEKLREIISKAASVRKEDRYSTAKELLDDVEKCGIEEKGFKITCKDNNSKPSFFTRYKKKIMTSVVAVVILAAVIICVPFVKRFIDDRSIPDEIRIGEEFFPIDSEKLDLSNRQLTNAAIANLKHMKNLKSLNLDDNFITDLSVLEELDQLEKLYFSNNNVSDISFVEDMDNLTHISGENSGVSDISPLKGKTKLTQVFFGNAYVTDITPLSDSRGLKKVGFNEAQIGDLEAFRGMTELEMVCLSGCNISDISPLADSHNLQYVYLGRNNVSDLSPLKNCIGITDLFLDNNPIKDSLATFEGITVYGVVVADCNELTDEDAEYLCQIMKGEFTIEY
ncbi:MAG: protein kinase [Oscillospiraceae bacterium]|nr:protein kinase [Oscillospiraceae bacterium]